MIIFKKSILAILLLFIFSSTLHTQSISWESTGNIGNKVVYKLDMSSSGLLFAGTEKGLYNSNDLGNNWTKLNNEFQSNRIYDLAATANNNVFTATKLGLYFSEDDGTTWTNLTTDLEQKWVKSIAARNDEIFIGAVNSSDGLSGTVYYSENLGQSWVELTDDMFVNEAFVKDFLIDENDSVYVLAAHPIIQSEFLYKLNETNMTWEQIFRYPPNIGTSVLTSNQANIFFGGTSDGVWKSHDKGRSWASAHLYPKSIEAILPLSDTSLYAATGYYGVFYSEDNGENWFQRNTGLTNTSVLSLIHDKDSGCFFAGTNGGGVFRANIITSVEDENQFLSSSFVLQQNYPNPFNPSTKIKYSIPFNSHVRIKIFNSLGEEVKTIINETVQAGSYEVDFNASNLSTGVYIYQLKTNSFISSKKMLYLK